MAVARVVVGVGVKVAMIVACPAALFPPHRLLYHVSIAAKSESEHCGAHILLLEDLSDVR